MNSTRKVLSVKLVSYTETYLEPRPAITMELFLQKNVNDF